MAAQELPAEKLVFGSYSPETDSRVEVYAIKLLRLAGEKESLILGGNTRRRMIS